jgi:hypothetical protein
VIFNTVPEKHYYDFYIEDGVDIKKVFKTLDLANNDLAVCLDVKPKSLRFDSRATGKIKALARRLANLLELVADNFEGNLTKVQMWFRVQNPMLGMIAPIDMIKAGRIDKLEKFIMDARMGNLP